MIIQKKFVRHENENIKATKSQKMSAAKKEMQKLSLKIFECSNLNLPRVKFDLTLRGPVDSLFGSQTLKMIFEI